MTKRALQTFFKSNKKYEDRAVTLFLDRSQCTYFVYQTEWPRLPDPLFSMSVACPKVRAMAPVNKCKMT